MNANFVHRLARLETKTEEIEKRQAEMAHDIKVVLETLNKGKGIFWTGWALLSLSSGAALFSLASIIGVN